jgi:serine/threonine-protein kinase
VPGGFDEWFLRACAREPERRFTSAREAAHELRRVLTPELLTPELAPSVEANNTAPPPPAPADTERWPGLSESRAVRHPEHPNTSTGASSATIQTRPQRLGRQTRLLGALAAGLMLLASYRFFHASQQLAPARPIATLQSALELRPANANAATLDETPPARAARPPETQRAPAPVVAAPPPAARRSARPPAVRTPARSERASFTITSTPPSRVLIDGQPKGTTPIHAVRVRPGTHRVTLIHGKQRKTMMVRGDPGENALVSARFSSEETPTDPTN